MKRLFLTVLAALLPMLFIQDAYCFKNLTVNGVVYSYPETDDLDWGDLATNWATAVSSTTFQKSGGTFTLTAEAYLGAIQGLRAAYFSSKNQPRASTGTFRMSSSDTIRWRDTANSTDVALGIDANSNLLWRGVILVGTNTVPASVYLSTNAFALGIAASTNAFAAAVANTTNSLRTDLAVTGVATGTLRADLSATGVTTGTLRTDLAVTGVATGTLRTDMAAIGVATGTLGLTASNTNYYRVQTGFVVTSTSVEVQSSTLTVRTPDNVSMLQIFMQNTVLGQHAIIQRNAGASSSRRIEIIAPDGIRLNGGFSEGVSFNNYRLISVATPTQTGEAANYEFVNIATGNKAVALDVAQATATLRTDLAATGVATGTLRTDLAATGVATGTLRTDLVATGVATGTLRTDMAAIGVATGTLNSRIVPNSSPYDLIVGTRGCTRCDVSIENTAQFNLVKSSFNLGGLAWSATAQASWFWQNGPVPLPGSVWPLGLTSTFDSTSVITNNGETNNGIVIYGRMNNMNFDALQVAFTTAQVKVASGAILMYPTFDGGNNPATGGLKLAAMVLLDHAVGAKIIGAKMKRSRGIGGVDHYGQSASLMIHESTGNIINFESWESVANAANSDTSVSVKNSTGNIISGTFDKMRQNAWIEIGGGGNIYQDFCFKYTGPFGDLGGAFMVGQTPGGFGNDIASATVFNRATFRINSGAGTGDLLRIGGIGVGSDISRNAMLDTVRFYAEGNLGQALNITPNALGSSLMDVKTFGWASINSIIGSTRSSVQADVWGGANRLAELMPSSATFGTDSNASVRSGGQTAGTGGDFIGQRLLSPAGNQGWILGADSSAGTANVMTTPMIVRLTGGKFQFGTSATAGSANFATTAVGTTTLNQNTQVFGTLISTAATVLDGNVRISTSPLLSGTTATGGSAATFSNCPAADCTNPFTWVLIKLNEATSMWVPGFK